MMQRRKGDGSSELGSEHEPHRISVVQELANAGLWAKSAPPLVLVNKVLLEESHSYSFTYCL